MKAGLGVARRGDRPQPGPKLDSEIFVKAAEGSLLPDNDLVDPIDRSEVWTLLSKAGLEVTLLDIPAGARYVAGFEP